MQAKRTENGQTLAKVQPQLSPSECVSAGQSEEVAGARVVDIQAGLIQVARTTGLGAYFPAPVDEGEVIGEVVAGLLLEM